MNETPTLVIADDEIHILRVVELKLSACGFTCVRAGNGLEAWTAVQRVRPDLVISDYQMPEMTGLELAHKMYDDPHLRAIPVLLLTARGFSLSADDLAQTNILYRMSKPFSPRELASRVRDVLLRSPKGVTV